VSVAVNLVMTVAQLVVGWLAHSQSLIAHGLHSFSDLLSDFLVIYANRQSAHPADQAHPYGHARVETAATLILGVSLTLIGGGILWDPACACSMPRCFRSIQLSALWVAIATVVSKEVLYRYLIRVAERLRSQLMIGQCLAYPGRCRFGAGCRGWHRRRAARLVISRPAGRRLDGLHDPAHGR
jgi:cation diffusion facilitator family transporter